jgi:sugar phosphate isomerase/epimerase
LDIGIGTYALFWEGSEKNPDRLTIEASVRRASDLGCDVFQICDDPRIESYTPSALAELRGLATSLSVRLELGTRRVQSDHLGTYIGIAEALGAPVLRSMIQADEVAGGTQQAIDSIGAVLPTLEQAGVTLALETYEQVSTGVLLDVVRALGTEHVGICLDPANCVSALELPNDVIDRCAPHTVDLHVKDFRFARQEGWVGFTYSGARMGDGLLDLNHELHAVYADGRNPAAIAEHWLPWQGDIASTVHKERDWTLATLEALRAY